MDIFHLLLPVQQSADDPFIRGSIIKSDGLCRLSAVLRQKIGLTTARL